MSMLSIYEFSFQKPSENQGGGGKSKRVQLSELMFRICGCRIESVSMLNWVSIAKSQIKTV